MTLPDLQSRKEIQILVDRFYDKVKLDPLLGPVFQHVNWSSHLPVMYNFWSSILLGDQSYDGNPFSKHIPLKIQAGHFTRWLQLFFETVDENFSGKKADEAKSRAENIASVFQFRLGLAK